MNRTELIRKAIALKHLLEYRKKVLDGIVLYRENMLRKVGRRKVENAIDDTLDIINFIQKEIEDLMNKIYE
jgi:hypothetical protein